MAKLHIHISPRIRSIHEGEAYSRRSCLGIIPISDVDQTDLASHVIFKDDRAYLHRLMSINYTTYDVRRAHDVIRPTTSKSNILLTAEFSPWSRAPENEGGPAPSGTTTGYAYARVLRIFHINVIYTGPGSIDFRPRRVDVLFVRYYCSVSDQGDPWASGELERLTFPPVVHPHAFGFVDPGDVLRMVHIVPRFSQGRKHPVDEWGLSAAELANDSTDWREYYVSR